MGNHTGKLIITVEDNTVGTGGSTVINGTRLQDGEFIVCAVDGEIEALVIVVDVGVRVISLVRCLKLVTGGLSGANGAAGVADCTTGVGTGTGEFLQGDGCDASHEDREGEDLVLISIGCSQARF